jgi:hypothetical protein
MTAPFRQFGDKPSVCKPKPAKKSDPVRVGTAYTWYCPHCFGFTITFFEEVIFGEGKCNTCSARVKLDLLDPGTTTPPMPARKRESGREPGIREIRLEG